MISEDEVPKPKTYSKMSANDENVKKKKKLKEMYIKT